MEKLPQDMAQGPGCVHWQRLGNPQPQATIAFSLWTAWVVIK